MKKENNGWIKTCDELPPDPTEKYYVCLDGIPHDHTMTGNLIKMNQELKKFEETHIVIGGRYKVLRKVTHWMPAVKLKAPLY